MSIFIAAVCVGLLVIGLSAFFQMALRRSRRERFKGLELKPNCLLTRYPIAFLSGPRSLFRLFDHWNDIPLYLREHGYEVFVIEATGRSLVERTNEVRVAINLLGTPCHLVADASLESDLQAIADMKIEKLATRTLIKTKARELFESRDKARTPNLNDLRPAASAVEIFEIDGSEFSLRTTQERLKLLLLGAHNFLIRRRTAFIHPTETAEFSFARPGFKMEERFLDLAISLAERDVMRSD